MVHKCSTIGPVCYGLIITNTVGLFALVVNKDLFMLINNVVFV